jgi:CHAT domain-containing protein
MEAPPAGLKVETALEEKERLFSIVVLLPVEEQDHWIQALKKEADRLIQVNYARCQALVELIFELAGRTGSARHQALGLLARANACAIGQGQYQAAVENYDQAVQLLGSIDRPVEQAVAMIGKLYALSNLGRYAQAMADGAWASQVLGEHAEWFHLARLRVNLAIVYGRMGEDEQALALLDQALQAYARVGTEPLSILRVEMNRAHLLRNLGRFQESIETSQRVQQGHAQLGRRLEAAQAQQATALTYFVLGRYNETLALLEQTRQVFLSDGRQRYAMLAELFMSDCLLQLRRFPEVLEKCKQVRQLFGELHAPFEVGQAILNEAAALVGMKEYARAKESLDEARALFEKEGNLVAVAETDLQTALVLLEPGRPDSWVALGLAQRAILAFARHNLPLWEARANLAAGRAALAGQGHGDPPPVDPEQFINRAIEIGLGHDLPAVTYPGYCLRGELAVRAGQAAQGLEAYERAALDLERLCGRLMVEFRANFIEDKEQVYQEIVTLYLQLGQPEKALTYAERARSRALLDMIAYRLDLSLTPRSEEDRPLVDELLGLRSERDRLYRRWQSGEGFGAFSALAQMQEEEQTAAAAIQVIEKRLTSLWHSLLIRSASYAREAGLWQVRTEPFQHYLEPNTRLIEYFDAGPGGLVAFVASRSSIQAVRLPGTLPALQSLLQFVQLNLRSVATLQSSNPAQIAGPRTANLRGLLQRLYAMLFAPLESALEGAGRLIVVPHGPLHYLPFQTLFDGQTYLLERYEISYLPGSSLLRYVSDPHPALSGQEVGRETGQMLAIGNSFNGRLPQAVEEARSVAALWNGKALLEEQATLEAFRQEAPGCRILHMATHGEFRPDNPLFSGLALAGGWLTTLDIFNLRLQGSCLVTLSACQTGRSVVGGGDELFGMMRAFLAAGATALVATFWTVEDRSTAQIMQNFYQRLAAGERKGSALRQAQLQFLNQDGHPAFRHPFFWAPFFLVGNSGTC